MYKSPAPVLGLDPSSSSTGIGLIDQHGVRRVEAVRMVPGETLRSAVERTIPAVHRVCGGIRPRLVIIEKPPGTARKDTERSMQADIGWHCGVSGALAVAELLIDGVPIIWVEPKPWRATMLIEAARAGLVLSKPTRRNAHRSLPRKRGKVYRDVKVFVQSYLGCEHTLRCEDFIALANGPETCAVCSTSTSKMRPADQVTDAWKAMAVQVCDHLWPGALDSVVADAQSRAKSVKERHRYVGVSDAAESLLVALHGASTLDTVASR